MQTNLVWHPSAVKCQERRALYGHHPCLLWYTGLSASGKSSIANAVDRLLFERGCATYLLDGDNVRHGLNADLGFDPGSRSENIRRVGEVAALLLDAGLVVGCAFISPYQAERQRVRTLAKGYFVEIYVDTPLALCEQRDPKGMYRRARAGEIADFTGISAPYEAPVAPEIHLQTASLSIDEAASKVVQWLEQHQLIPAIETE
ncbi:adenylyl-sulfate kinase [Alkalimonas sp.]|uniref:adenylyl-sulfate kinase n=1 Tax=Alkalimonas sp. TaxID=1872453 RepID=UPI00263BA4B6|nr:adenylyl-sulfate kinase [Alkalimonas sp.]MCC5824619.1 adenylyl-sulfate kinase [Alkalimonas sp.]